jgi:putative membrane protein
MHVLIQLFTFDWPWRPLTTFILLAMMGLYLWGWLRARRAYPKLATPIRLLSFAAGVVAVALAMISPIYLLHGEMLAARTVQQILLGIIAPPLLWLGCPFHVIVWGMPVIVRKVVTRRILLRSATGRLSRFLTRPMFAWLGTLTIFLVWHEPQIVAWTLQHDAIYALTLWIFLMAYLLFWWHLVGTGPRIHAALPSWVAFFYIILGGELPNMVTGVTLAFRDSPAYAEYAMQSDLYGFSSLQDQMVSGGMIWLFGSLAYVTAAIMVLARGFQPGDGPPRLPIYWEASERSIAPGLEHRVIPEHLRKPNQYSNQAISKKE